MSVEYRDEPVADAGTNNGANGDVSNGTSVNPAAIGGESAPAAPARKLRKDGRPWGSGPSGSARSDKSKVKTNTGSLDLSGIHALFVSTHVVIAKATGISEIEITDVEGENFLKACENVARHYSVTTTQKTLDWFALAGLTVQIYGTRAMVIIADKKPAAKPASENNLNPLSSSSVPGPALHIVPAAEE